MSNSIVGTWVFKDTIDLTPLYDGSETYVYFYIDYEYGCVQSEYDSVGTYMKIYKSVDDNILRLVYNDTIGGTADIAYNNRWIGYQKTITINGGADVENETFVNWLNANATKQYNIVGTWRFKDGISFEEILNPNTSSAGYGETEVAVTFSCMINGQTINYIKMYIANMEFTPHRIVYYTADGTATGGYYSADWAKPEAGKWNSNDHRTITILENTDNPDFYEWLHANAKKVTRKLTRLYPGPVVAKGTTRQLRKLVTEGSKANPYLTFSSPNSFTLATNNTTKNWDGELEYSTDTTTWNVWDGTTTLSADSGKLYMRGTGNTKITGSATTSRRWSLVGSDIDCSGNVENLLDYATVINGGHPTMADYCYYSMFYDCTSLTTAPELPATMMTDYCYSLMFSGCTSLTTAPELPATTLADYCYSGIFRGCTNLTTVSTLPATTLAENCYHQMLRDCTSLTTAPKLPATTLADYCYAYMFTGCTSLTTAPKLPATTLAENCYYSMFSRCTSLTTAPKLPATTLAVYCYTYMFSRCTSLTTAPELPATTLADYCYDAMFNGCTSLTTAPALPATMLSYSCYDSMFLGCTSLTTAPELPATTAMNHCYVYMFSGCTSLTTAPELPATTLADYCYRGMFVNCTSLTTTPELPATTLALACYAEMFMGCASLDTVPELPTITLANSCYAYMFEGCTAIKLSTTKTGEYQKAYRIPASGTGTTATDALAAMFTNTGGTFTGTPSLMTTYYTSNEVIRVPITFTIDGTSYQARNYQTWREWVTTANNTAGYSIKEILYQGATSEYVVVSSTDNQHTVLDGKDDFVRPDDLIIDGRTYPTYTLTEDINDPYGLIGTWTFSGEPNTRDVDRRYTVDFIFTQDNVTYTCDVVDLYYSYAVSPTRRVMCYWDKSSTDTYVAWVNSDGWIDEQFKTITIVGGVDITNEEFATWLKSKATKVESTPEPEPYPITFTAVGNTLTAEVGMTWDEWLKSDYNTTNFSKVTAYIGTNSYEAIEVASAGGGYITVLSDSNGVIVRRSDVIIANHAYTGIDATRS